uniref:Uncharacterized protein n=1 Tax=Anguilla anguilla TaxID=7936 RepID=A0A0E9Q7I9_ANGAN
MTGQQWRNSNLRLLI